jgi:hypothetical protein
MTTFITIKPSTEDINISIPLVIELIKMVEIINSRIQYDPQASIKALSKLLSKVLGINMCRSIKFKVDTKAPHKNPEAQRFCFKKDNMPTVANVINMLFNNIFLISYFIAFNPIIDNSFSFLFFHLISANIPKV